MTDRCCRAGECNLEPRLPQKTRCHRRGHRTPNHGAVDRAIPTVAAGDSLRQLPTDGVRQPMRLRCGAGQRSDCWSGERDLKRRRYRRFAILQTVAERSRARWTTSEITTTTYVTPQRKWAFKSGTPKRSAEQFWWMRRLANRAIECHGNGVTVDEVTTWSSERTHRLARNECTPRLSQNWRRKCAYQGLPST